MPSHLLADQFDTLLGRHAADIPPTLLGGLRTSASTSVPSCPERALLEAVLREAILCATGQGEPARDRARLADEARHWMMSRARNWLFAFENICDVLNINPDCVRRQLFALKDAPAAVRGGGISACHASGSADMVKRMRIVRMRGNQHPRKMYRRRVRRRG